MPSASLAAPVYGQSQFFGAAVATVPALGVATGTFQFYVDGLKFGAPVSMVNGAAFSPSIATLGAGVHHVAAVYSGDANYASIATPVLTETIARVPLLIVANTSARVYGQPNLLLTASYYGFVNGDTPASLTSPAFVATLANQISPVGSYGIAVAGATSPNYAITFLAGTLTILPTPAGATRQLLADSAFVTTLYAEVLGRTPDIAGFEFWVQILARGVNESAVASAFWNSREHVVLVASGRAPLIPQAVVLQDALTTAWIAFVLGAFVPAGPLAEASPGGSPHPASRGGRFLSPRHLGGLAGRPVAPAVGALLKGRATSLSSTRGSWSPPGRTSVANSIGFHGTGRPRPASGSRRHPVSLTVPRGQDPRQLDRGLGRDAPRSRGSTLRWASSFPRRQGSRRGSGSDSRTKTGPGLNEAPSGASASGASLRPSSSLWIMAANRCMRDAFKQRRSSGPASVLILRGFP